MNEQDFWNALYSHFRLAGLEWSGVIDWIEPKRYLISKELATISGKLGTLNEGEWKFQLDFVPNTDELSKIKWELLNNQINESIRIEIDEQTKTVEISFV